MLTTENDGDDYSEWTNLEAGEKMDIRQDQMDMNLAKGTRESLIKALQTMENYRTKYEASRDYHNFAAILYRS